MIHFLHIEYLLLLVLVPVLYFLYLQLVRWKKNTASKIGDPLLVKELIKEYAPGKFRMKFILISLAVALCVVGVAGLARPDAAHKIQRKGSDIVIALDVSKSMLATDIKPDRLERAKQLISKIIDQSPNDRIGLVIFAGKAYLQMPLTLDRAAARMYISSARPSSVPTQGTVLSEALRMSMDAFDPQDKTFKSVLLISDGEDHEPGAVKMANELLNAGIIVNTVGIGSPLGAPVPDEQTGQYKTDEKGQTVISKLNEEALKNIAKAGNGIYQYYTNTDEIAQNMKTKFASADHDSIISDATYGSFIHYFQYFAGAALLLLLLEFFISEKRKRVGAALFIGFLFCLPAGLQAQSSQGNMKHGNRSYIENRFDEAEADYKEVLRINPKDAIANYNLGNTLYRKQQPEEAVKLYEEAIANTEDRSLQQKSYYNKGVALQKMDKLPECIISYKNALLLDPSDEEARQNLQRALQKQKEQENQQQQNQKENKQDQKQSENNPDQQKRSQPQPSRLTREQAEEKLKSLSDNEKALQDKLNKVKGVVPNNPEKDW